MTGTKMNSFIFVPVTSCHASLTCICPESVPTNAAGESFAYNRHNSKSHDSSTPVSNFNKNIAVLPYTHMLLSTPIFDPSVTAADFSLEDVISGQTVSLTDVDPSHGFVVAFICNHCPYVQAVIDELVVTANELKTKNIPVFAIMSNNYEFVEGDSPENMKVFASEHNFSFPYLVDEDQSAAKAYGAICTPDIFGFDSNSKMQYRGAVEGLKDAMLAITETGSTTADQTPSQGCSIKWK